MSASPGPGSHSPSKRQVDENGQLTHTADSGQLHNHLSKTGDAAGVHIIGLKKQGKAQGEYGTAQNGCQNPAEFLP